MRYSELAKTQELPIVSEAMIQEILQAMDRDGYLARHWAHIASREDRTPDAAVKVPWWRILDATL